MPTTPDVPSYNPDIADEFERDEGMSPNDAVLQASTTMDGAYENPSGGIHAKQTACNVLSYDEALPESKEVKKGRKQTRGAIREEFDLEKGTNIDKFVDDWIKQQEAKLGK